METKSIGWQTLTRKNVLYVAYWTGAWVLTTALATFGPKMLWDYNSILSILAILVNVLVGVGMILANRKYTNGLDELQRKVTLEAKAIAFGVAVVGGVCFSVLHTSHIISFEPEIGHLIVLIAITYVISFIIGSIRYK
jgi:hypothetical protein